MCGVKHWCNGAPAHRPVFPHLPTSCSPEHKYDEDKGKGGNGGKGAALERWFTYAFFSALRRRLFAKSCCPYLTSKICCCFVLKSVKPCWEALAILKCS